jgi:DNA-binding protein H-NS
MGRCLVVHLSARPGLQQTLQQNSTRARSASSPPCAARHANWADQDRRHVPRTGLSCRVPEYARCLVHPRMSPYMATKKTGPTLTALNAQIAKLQAQAEALRAKEVAGVVARIREAIVHYGLTVADLGLGSAKSKAPKGAAATATPKPKAKPAGKKAARTIKFADGKGGTWSGIGKRPNWFKDALAAGRKPEDLLAKPDA